MADTGNTDEDVVLDHLHEPFFFDSLIAHKLADLCLDVIAWTINHIILGFE